MLTFSGKLRFKLDIPEKTGLPKSASREDLQATAAGQLIGGGVHKPSLLDQLEGVEDAKSQIAEVQGPWREPGV